MQGGKQWKVIDQSVGYEPVSARCYRRVRERMTKPRPWSLFLGVSEAGGIAVREMHRVVGDGMVEQVLCMDRGDLDTHRDR